MDDIDDLAKRINALADELPTTRVLQELRDKLTLEAEDMLRGMIEETQP